MTCCPWPQHCTCNSTWSPSETIVVDVPHTRIPMVLAAPSLHPPSAPFDLARSGDSWEHLLRELEEGLN